MVLSSAAVFLFRTVVLTAEISWRVWGTPANFDGFRFLADLPHGTLVVGVSQTLWR